MTSTTKRSSGPERPSVWFVASDRDGGGRVRSFWPAAELRRRGWWAQADVVPPPPGSVDVVVFHRPLDQRMPAAVVEQRRAGAVVLVDEDDDLAEVPESNVWQPSPAALARHDQAVADADGLVVTTPALAARYGPLARRVWLAPNFLPRSAGAHRYHGARDVVRVGWAGKVETHRDDLEWIAPHLGGALGGATLSLVGDPSALRVLRCHRLAHETFGWQHGHEALYKRMARADIGIVPLVPTAFNVAKSWLKALEYMTLGVPVVVADLPEQRRLVEDGVTGFVAGDPAEFAVRVAKLVGDPGLRAEMGRAARARAGLLSLERQGDVWETVLLNAVRAPAAA